MEKRKKISKELLIELAIILVAGTALLFVFRYEDIKSFIVSALN